MNKYDGMKSAAQELNARYLVAPYGVRKIFAVWRKGESDDYL